MKKIFALTFMFIPKLIFAQAWAMHEAAEAAGEAGVTNPLPGILFFAIIGVIIKLFGKHNDDSNDEGRSDYFNDDIY